MTVEVKTCPSRWKSCSSYYQNFQLFNGTMHCKWRICVEKVYNFYIFQKLIPNRSPVMKQCSSCKMSNSESNSSNSDAVSLDKKDFSDRIIKWAIQNNISYFAFSQLLKVLSDYGLKDLPKNARTLLKAKEMEVKVSTVPPGTYTHFGLEKNLKNVISNLVYKKLLIETNISLSIFIDNLPLSSITQRGLWVILGSIVGFSNIIFFIGAYHGYSKPNNPNSFLSEFVEDAKYLCEQGLEINQNRYSVKIKRLICDAPAKAFVLNVKNFGGYSSCLKCKTIGKYKNKSICFEENSALRTDEDFHSNEVYTNCKTVLLEIPNFGVVSSVPLDYMHLVCLGVVKKLLTIWLSDKEFWELENSESDLLKALAYSYPCEFKKKPKSLSLFTRWSGNEFRQFLLYYGAVILKKNLKDEYYDHFLLLHVACRLLCMKASPENVGRGRQLLHDFVKNYKNLYRGEQITHNVHGLYHLADDCSSHGTLDGFSSFSFENFLLNLRGSMKKSKKKSIPQVILQESYDKVFSKSLQKVRANDFKAFKKLKPSTDEQFRDFARYERLLLKNADIVPQAEGNNYVFLKNKKLIQVTDILEKKEQSNKILLVAGKEFNSVSSFYSEPFSDYQLHTFKAENLSGTINLWPVEMIDRKCMKIPVQSNELVLVGLVNENF